MNYEKIMVGGLIAVAISVAFFVGMFFFFIWLDDGIERNSEYMCITDSAENVTEAEKQALITEFIEQYELKGINIEERLAGLHKSYPEHHRRLETHKFRGNYYLCYVVRPYPGLRYAYIWIYNPKEKFFWPMEGCSFDSPQEDMTLRYKPEQMMDYFKELSGLSGSDIDIVNFYSDREVWLTGSEYKNRCFAKVSKKYNVTPEHADGVYKIWINALKKKPDSEFFLPLLQK